MAKDIKVGTLSPEERRKLRQLAKYEHEAAVAVARAKTADMLFWHEVREAHKLSHGTSYSISSAEGKTIIELVV